MGYLDEAFTKMKHALEITQTEQDQAKRRHEAARDHVRSAWKLSADFLTGSYVRDTKTKKLKDVDVFVVIDAAGPQGTLRSLPPSSVLSQLADVLRSKYPDAYADQIACVIPFGSDDEVMSLDIVPAFERSGGGYQIPDVHTGGWIDTDPNVHWNLSIAKNKVCDGKFVPFVKMIKGMNRELGEPVRSFLLEVMAQSLVEPPFTDYPSEIRFFLASAREQIHNAWPDPAGLGPDVNTLSSFERMAAATALSGALQVAERAIHLGDSGQERAAVEAWRELFGWRMPRP
ncbi:MAG: CBASS oligonucleotide cyclase [Actinomycetota bacterium]|nr:CBASS oligonucleotide cyclase [Actinomycetota bacterium]